MKKFILIVCAALLVLPVFNTPLMAQEDISFESLFAYFPDGVYREFGFFNMKAARETAVYPVLHKLGSVSGDMMIVSRPPLPESFQERIDFIAMGRFGSLAARKQQEKIRTKVEQMNQARAGGAEMSREDRQEIRQIAQKLREQRSQGTIWVVTIPGIDGLIAENEESGTFVKTGQKAAKRPIYDIRVKSGSDVESKTSELLGYVAPSGDLLLTSDMETLRTMIDCYQGGQSSLIDNQHYMAALVRVDRSHQGWTVSPHRGAKLRMIDELILSGGRDEEITELEKSASQGEINAIQSMLLTDEILIRRLSEFSSEEEAEAEFKRTNDQFSQAQASISNARKSVKEQQEDLSPRERRITGTAMGFANNLLSNRSITQDGPAVITEIYFNKKQLGTLNMLLSFAKSMEEQERRKQEQEAAKQ